MWKAAVIGAMLAASSTVFAQGAPATVSFVARLQDQGLPLMGSHDFKFALYDAPTGGTMVWQETRTGVPIGDEGLLYLDLGSVTALTAQVFAGNARYLEITIDTNPPASPRILIESVPYALRSGKASDADALQGSPASAFQKSVTNSCSGTQAIQTIAADGTVTCYTGQTYTATTGGGLVLTSNMFSVDPTVYQKRISGCAAGAIASVAQTGTATCITAGTGISASSMAAGTFAVDFSAVQRAVTSCSAGFLVNGYSGTGTPTCYGAGTGLTFNSGSGTWDVDTTTIQKRVTGTCSSGAITAIAANGSVTCGGGSGSSSTIVAAVVATAENTGSTSYTDLTTAGPAVTATIGASGAAIVTLTARVDPPSSNTIGYMGFAVSGATTVAASDNQALIREFGSSGGTGYIQASATFYVTGLTAGSNTFTAKYKDTGGGNATFTNRNLIVQPL